MSLRFEADATLQAINANLQALPRWLPAIVRVHLDTLGTIAVDRMRETIEPHRYTGVLQDSIEHHPEDGGYTQAIYPTAQRGGRWDAGALLELGTAPIPRLPWAPIKAWAEFRGVPAFPVWYKIRTQGVSPHPFLERTMTALGPQIEEAAFRIVTTMVGEILRGGGTESIGAPAP